MYSVVFYIFFTAIVPNVLSLPNSIITNHFPGCRLRAWLHGYYFMQVILPSTLKDYSEILIHLLPKLFPKCLFSTIIKVFLLSLIPVPNSKPVFLQLGLYYHQYYVLSSQIKLKKKKKISTSKLNLIHQHLPHTPTHHLAHTPPHTLPTIASMLLLPDLPCGCSTADVEKVRQRY